MSWFKIRENVYPPSDEAGEVIEQQDSIGRCPVCRQPLDEDSKWSYTFGEWVHRDCLFDIGEG